MNAYLVCNTKYKSWDSRMIRVDGRWTSVASRRFWRIGVLTAAGAIGSASSAEAALYYYPDSDPGFYRPGPMVPQQRQRVRRQSTKKIQAPEKDSAKPQGPLVIAISIQKQKLRIYDANGFFAESPISTGMPGHSTPMGVFSVIQKQKLHHSNIYSGAPMPYMQRITWSGIAIHAGVLPGYPASHGCIRMPMAFAVKMWGWTRMGARVVITPGEISPSSFSHPLLVAQKVVPEPATADEPKTDAPPAAKSDKASDAGPAIKPATSEVALELRSTVELPLSVPIPANAKLKLKCRHFLAKPNSGGNIDEWAADLHMSRRAFTRLFRQETGMSLSEWRQQAIVVTALSRLASGEPVTVVALDCGYSNAGAFSSMFRRVTGTAPTQYVFEV